MNAAAQPAPVAKPDLGVLGVVLGRSDQRAYAMLDDGSIVCEGDSLNGGFYVDKVDFNRLVVRHGAQRFVYYVGALKHGHN